MSAQLAPQGSTRLLVAVNSENAAHELDSVLRNAGISARLTVSDDPVYAAQLLAEDEVDLALVADYLPSLDQILPRMRSSAPHTPIIVLNTPEADQPLPTVTAMSCGATDVVPISNPELLVLVLRREFENIVRQQEVTQMRRALTEAEQRCQLLLQGSRLAISYVHEGMHIHGNEQYLDLFNYTDADELAGEPLMDVVSEDCAGELKEHLKSLRTCDEEVSFQFTGRGENPVTGTMNLKRSNYDGEPCLQVTVRPDLEDSAAEVEQPVSEELGLTGFVRTAEGFFANASADPYVLVVSVDHPEELTRTYGLVGTETIYRKVWLQLRESGSEYPATRLGDGRYGVAIVGRSYDEVVHIAEKIRNDIAEMIFEIQEKTVRPTVTVTGTGVDSQHDVTTCLDLSHQLLMDLVEKGEANTLDIPDTHAELPAEVSDASIVLRHITEAIEQQKFILQYQPVVSLRGDTDEQYEVFLRMLDNEGELIAPLRFMQTAIDNDVAGKIDRWVILQAIKKLSVQRASGSTTRITITITSNSINDGEFLDWLAVALKAAHLPSDAVIFQVTEGDATTYLRQTGAFVEGLKKLHCQASLSRFGSVDDPFKTLKHVPVDMVKVDGDLVRNIATDLTQRDELVELINQLQSQGKLTIAPKVENAQVLATLWHAGVNYIQGHYLQEPGPEMDYDFGTDDG